MKPEVLGMIEAEIEHEIKECYRNIAERYLDHKENLKLDELSLYFIEKELEFAKKRIDGYKDVQKLIERSM
jgi:hypothetical protein